MPQNIVETISNYFTPDFVNQAASKLGESNSGISKALSAIIPISLAGILNKTSSGPDGESSIFNMASAAEVGLPALAAYDSLASHEASAGGGSLLSSLFAGNKSGMASAIAGYAGINNISVLALLSRVVLVTMGLLGRHAKQNNLSASDLSEFLAGQQDNIMHAMPAGLSSIIGMPGVTRSGNSYTSPMPPKVKVERRPNEIVEADAGNKWVVPLIIAVVALVLLWYFLRSCNDTKETITSTIPAVVSSADTASIVVTQPEATEPDSIKVQLPNGKTLDANRGGIEDLLVTFLSGDWKSMSEEALKEKWFDFDNLNFNTGTATLLPESEKQLSNIAEILKAFPDAKIKIGGYTDAAGNPIENTRLSQERADAARAGLVRLGVGAQLLEAEGYGSQFAKFPANATEDERALDRHVSVSVRK